MSEIIKVTFKEFFRNLSKPSIKGNLAACLVLVLGTHYGGLAVAMTGIILGLVFTLAIIFTNVKNRYENKKILVCEVSVRRAFIMTFIAAMGLKSSRVFILVILALMFFYCNQE